MSDLEKEKDEESGSGQEILEKDKSSEEDFSEFSDIEEDEEDSGDGESYAEFDEDLA